MTLEIDIVCLFPEMLEGPLSASIPGRIQAQGLAAIRVHDLRQWGIGRHSQKHGGSILPDMMRWLWRDHPVSTDVNDMVERGFNGGKK